MVGVYYVTGQANFARLIHLFNGNLVYGWKENNFNLG
jgi:hypothetical protein